MTPAPETSRLPTSFAEACGWASRLLTQFDERFHVDGGNLAERAELRAGGVAESTIESLYPFSLRNYSLNLAALLNDPEVVKRVNEGLRTILLYNQFEAASPAGMRARGYDLYGFIWPTVDGLQPVTKENFYLIPSLLHTCARIDQSSGEDWSAEARLLFLDRLPHLRRAVGNLFAAVAN